LLYQSFRNNDYYIYGNGKFTRYSLNKLFDLADKHKIVDNILTQEFNLLTASLIFIYGLPEGTLKANYLSYDKNKLGNLITTNLILFLAPFLLFLTNNTVLNYVSIFTALISGVFFGLLFNRKVFIKNIYK